jgi:hypothetical protein
MEQRESEAARGIPIQYWSFERGIADAARVSAMVSAILRSEQARTAGKALKTDALQKLILRIVRKCVDINVSELLVRLRSAEGNGVIDKVDGDDVPKPAIHFCQRDRIKEAPVSGLKDRLARAKKIVQN